MIFCSTMTIRKKADHRSKANHDLWGTEWTLDGKLPFPVTTLDSRRTFHLHTHPHRYTEEKGRAEYKEGEVRKYTHTHTEANFK